MAYFQICLLTLISWTWIHVSGVPIIGETIDGDDVITDNQDEGEVDILINSIIGVVRLISIPDFANMAQFSWTNGGLEYFPDFINVSDSMTRLILDNNKIRSLPKDLLEKLEELNILSLMDNDLATFPKTTSLNMNLRYLYLDKNRITSLPEIGTLGSSVWELHLNENPLARIPPDLPPMPSVWRLQLKNCKLTRPPSCDLVPGVTGSILVPMEGNPIETFDPRGMNLDCIDFRYLFNTASLTTVPKLCRMPILPGQVWWAAITPPIFGKTFVDCDCSALWDKIAVASGMVSALLACRSPPSLNGLYLSDVDASNLTCATTMKKSLVLERVVPSMFGCTVPSVTESFTVQSVTECAERCVVNDKCLFIRINLGINDEMICGLTDAVQFGEGGDKYSGMWYQLL